MTEDQDLERELEEQDGQPLPDREVMSVITPEPTTTSFIQGDEPATNPGPPVDWMNESNEGEEPLRGGEPL
jgi:hypothetical protein